MPSGELAQLAVLLTVEDKLTAGLNRATREIEGTGKAMAATGAAMSAMGAAGVAGFGAAVAAASEFESAMSGIRAVLGPGDWQRFGGALDDLAKRLGKDTVFSAKEAADAINELIKAGVSAEDVLGGAAEAVTSLAAAGGVSIKEAAEIAANAANVFGIAGGDMAQTADTIAGAVNASAISMNDFRFSLQMVGAVAQGAGQSFDETARAIAVLGQAGLKGSDAGTSLKTMLVNLVPSSKTASGAFRELGLLTDEAGNAFFDAAGNAKSLTDVAGVLNKAFAGLTDERRISLMHDAFGTDAMRAANILARAGAEGMGQMADAMGRVTAQGVAAVQLDNLNGAMKNLQGSIETLMITVGQKLTPVIRGLAEAIKGAVDGFMNLPGPVQETVVAVGLAVTAFTALGGPILLATAALPALAGALGVVGGALAAVALPVAALGVAVAALAAAWANDWQGMRTQTLRVVEHIQPVLERLGELFGRVVKGIGDALDTAARQFGAFWAALTGEAESGSDAVVSAADQVIRWFHDDLLPAVEAGVAAWEGFWTQVNDTAVAAVNEHLLPALRSLSAWYRETLQPALEEAGQRWTAFWDEAGPTLVAAWAVAEPILGAIAAWYRETLAKALELAGTLLAAWVDNFKKALQTLATVLGPVAEAIGGKAREMNRALQEGLAQMAPQAAAAAEDVNEELLAEIQDTGAEVRALANEVGHEYAAGLIAGMEEVTAEVVRAARAQVRAAMEAAKAEAEIGSPSQLFAREVGQPIGAGIGLGIGQAMQTLDWDSLLAPPPLLSAQRRGKRIITRNKYTGAPQYAWDELADLDAVERWQEMERRNREGWVDMTRTRDEWDRLAALWGPQARPFSGAGWKLGGPGMPSAAGLGGLLGEGGATLLGESTAAMQAFDGATTEVVTTLSECATLSDLTVAAFGRQAVALAAATDAVVAYTAAALTANSLNTRLLNAVSPTSGMQAGQLPGHLVYAGVGGGSEWQALYGGLPWTTNTGQYMPPSGLTGNPYYPSYGAGAAAEAPVTVIMETPPALITPQSRLDLDATATQLAPMVADRLQRLGRLGAL